MYFARAPAMGSSDYTSEVAESAWMSTPHATPPARIVAGPADFVTSRDCCALFEVSQLLKCARNFSAATYPRWKKPSCSRLSSTHHPTEPECAWLPTRSSTTAASTLLS